MRHVHLLIKPASGLCNLNCRYCFYHDIVEKREQASYGLMTEDTLAAVLEKALAAASHSCTIAFQGGEPTLAGLDFFRKAVELQRRLNVNRVQVYNSIQTNGLLLDSQWAAFFRENHFLVGLSLDGMKDTHDLYRLDAQGQGTFNRAARVLQLLESHGVAYNILTVVNRVTAQHVEKIYRFYQRNCWGYLQFIPCLDPLGEEPGSQEYSLTPEAYGDFLCRLFDLWYRDAKMGRAPSIRQFENYVEMLLGYPPEACGMAGVCGMQHVVEADGSVYPCDFYVLDGYRLGNLRENSLEEVNQRRKTLGFVEQSRAVDPACQACGYFPLCRGGCRRYRPAGEEGSLGRNCLCEGYRKFFGHALPRLRELAGMAAVPMVLLLRRRLLVSCLHAKIYGCEFSGYCGHRHVLVGWLVEPAIEMRKGRTCAKSLRRSSMHTKSWSRSWVILRFLPTSMNTISLQRAMPTRVRLL